MTIADKTLFVCNCNKTMPLDGAALGRALGTRGATASCIRCCASASSRSSPTAPRGDLIVACTQEQRLLGDVAEEGGRRRRSAS